jgi:uncharacterized protein YegJ (DUF2314 family)
MRLLSRRLHASLLAVAACAAALTACHAQAPKPITADGSAQEPNPIRTADGSVVPVKASDAVMNAAIANAQQTLPVFWSVFDRQSSGFDQYRMKIAFPITSGGSEAMWIQPTAHNSDDIAGVLVDDPEFRTDLKNGMTVHVKVPDVRDWGYRHSGKVWGNFTTVVLFGEMSPAEAAEMRSSLGPTRLEPGA